MTTLSKEQIEKIRAEAGKATAPPWQASKVDDVGGGSIYGDLNNPLSSHRRIVASGAFDVEVTEEKIKICRPIYPCECDNNTAFIASSRTNVPELCNTALELMDRVEELRGAILEYSEHSNHCPVNFFEAGKPTESGYKIKNKGKWYNIEDTPKCTCGLSAVLESFFQEALNPTKKGDGG